MWSEHFFKVVLSGFAFLILAVLVMLPVHFFTDYDAEWKISCFVLFLYGLTSPLLSLWFKGIRDYFVFSLITAIALFFDLSILAMLVTWKPWSFTVYNLQYMLISLAFFFVSWAIWLLFSKLIRK